MQGSAEFRLSEEVASEGLLAAGLANGTDGLASHAHNTTLFDTGSASLREAAAARVAAHRSKRAGAHAMEAAREEALRQEHARVARESRHGAAKVRDAVRARYERTQSYRDFLAAEAERAMQQARAEAEIAARNAKAIADAQMQLLEELREQESVFETASQSALVSFDQQRVEPARAAWHHGEAIPVVDDHSAEFVSETADLFAEPDAPVKEISSGGLTVRLYDDAPPVAFPALNAAGPERRSRARVLESEELDELEGLEQEIAFRRAPEFEDHIIETLPLPANLIEFPRELVAARKARPRLAEGPLREEGVAEPQLRIFEVESEQISIAPAAPEEVVTGAPVWQGLMLDAAPLRAPRSQQHVAASLVDIAPISRRLMSAVVDACCVGVAMIGFWTVAAWISGPRLTAMSRPMLAIAVVLTLAIAAMMYQVLFFCMNDATPGMRYARIALCTFAERSPTRRAMRRRLLAMLMAVCPLGLGMLWAWMDDDRLAWHDRISRMYQRMY
jgi:uncharacterized RDD family membrane protein YckC